MKLTSINTSFDRTALDVVLQKLSPSNEAMLLLGQPLDHSVRAFTQASSIPRHASPVKSDAFSVPEPDNASLVKTRSDGARCRRTRGAHSVSTSASHAQQKRPQPAVAASGFDPFK